MLATIVLAAAALPLGVWPAATGGAAVTVHGVEFYVLDPDDDYTIIAVRAFPTPLKRAEHAELNRLAELAGRLGADAVLFLGEMPEKAIPDDPDAPLPTTGRYVAAVFLSFDSDEGSDGGPSVPSAAPVSHGHRHHAAIKGTRAAPHLSERVGGRR